MTAQLGGSLNGWVIFGGNIQKHTFLLLMKPGIDEAEEGSSLLTPILESSEWRTWTTTGELAESLFVRFHEDADLVAEDAPSSGPIFEIQRYSGDGLLMRQDGKMIRIPENEMDLETFELVSQIDSRALIEAESLLGENNVSDFAKDVNWVITELITIVVEQTPSEQRNEVLITIVNLQEDLLALESPDSVLDPERLALLQQVTSDLKRLAPAAYAKFEELLFQPAIGAAIGLAIQRFLTP